jgi:hypothetical protein
VTNEDAIHQIEDALAIGALTAGALLLEHLAFWPWAKHLVMTDELAPLAPYVVGTATIGVGLSALGLRRPLQLLDFWIIAGCGGATIAAARIWRFLLNQDRAAATRQGRTAGQVAGGRNALEAYTQYRAGN